MNHIIKLVLLLLCVAMCACKSDMVREDSTMRLSFSTDTLCFDTIFTEAGSTTARVMIYNKVLSLPLGFFSEERKGDIIARMSGDVTEIETSVTSS